jgi:hypothetical protein
MTGPVFDAAERAQLSDLLDELGPEAPTLLAPWTARDMAAHLVLRERDPLAEPRRSKPCDTRGWHVTTCNSSYRALIQAGCAFTA